MKTVSYLRVSTIAQETDKFKSSVEAYASYKNLSPVDHIEETVSGRKVDWKSRSIFGIINDPDVSDIIVPELSRLARSTKQILEIIECANEANKTIHLVKEGLIVNNGSNATTKMFLTILSAVAQMEADLISERTKEALQAKKAKGVVLGRRKGSTGIKKLDEYKDEIDGYLANGKSKSWIATKLGVSRPTLYAFIKRNEESE